MRAIVLAIVVLQAGLGRPVYAENPPAPERSISEILPLFEKNRCGTVRDPADQLFCGDPELNTTGARLSSAVQDRLNRLPDRRLAIEENVEWIRNRNSSCGIFGRQSVSARDVNSVRTCLLKETEERIAILADPDFDCLAENTTAGLLICSDPALATADKELAGHVLGLIARLKESEAESAFAEYARWIRDRDRRCDLADKDNVPLEELSSSESCLADYIRQKTAEIAAARGDPKRVFAQPLTSSSPNADAVDLCVAQIHSSNICQNFLRVSSVDQIDSDVKDQSALVSAEIEMVVLSPFAGCSPIATNCTGTCWDLKSGKAGPSPGSNDSFSVSYRLRIEKSFAFQKTDSGGWRCGTTALPPIDLGVATIGP